MKIFRYLFEAMVAYGIYGISRLLSVEASSYLVGNFTKLIGPLLKAHKIAKKNLAFAFPEKSDKERAVLLDKVWENLGRAVGEFSFIGQCDKEQFKQYVEVEHEEILSEYLVKGKPAIFFSAHLANWELAPKTAAIHGTPLALVYRPSNNPLVEKLVRYVRRSYQSESIAKGKAGARDIMRCLKEGQPVGMLLDQKMNDGIAVPFFGRKAMTASAVVNLAKRFQCPVIPAQIIRKTGVNFKVIIHKPLVAKQIGDDKQDSYDFMCQINDMIEGWVRQHPEQWFWVHNRWPKEEPKEEK